MSVDENVMKQMDEAAAQAKAEFEQNFSKWAAQDVIIWWAKWYLKAGHKRLGRILVAISKNLQQ